MFSRFYTSVVSDHLLFPLVSICIITILPAVSVGEYVTPCGTPWAGVGDGRNRMASHLMRQINFNLGNSMEKEPGNQENGLPPVNDVGELVANVEKSTDELRDQEKSTKMMFASASDDEYDPESLTVPGKAGNLASNATNGGHSEQGDILSETLDSDYDPESSLVTKPATSTSTKSFLPAKPQSGPWPRRVDGNNVNPGVWEGDQGNETFNGPSFQRTLAAVIKDVGNNPSFNSLPQDQQARIITSELSKRGVTTLQLGPNVASNFRHHEFNNTYVAPRNGYGRPEFSVPMTPEDNAKYEEFLKTEALIIHLPLWDKLPEHLRLFVGNLPLKFVTKEELFRVFSKYGNLLEILIRQGYGFIQYDTDEAVQKCIQGETGVPLHNRVLRFDPTHPFKRKKPVQNIEFLDNQGGLHGKREYNEMQGGERTVAREREQPDVQDLLSAVAEEVSENQEQSEHGPPKKRQRVEEAECTIYITAESSPSLIKVVQQVFSKSKVLQFEVEDISDGDLQESMSDAAYSGAIGTCVIKEDTVDVLTFEQTEDGGVKFDEYSDVDPNTAVEILEQFALGDEIEDKVDDEGEVEEGVDGNSTGDEGVVEGEAGNVKEESEVENRGENQAECVIQQDGAPESRAESEEYVPTHDVPQDVDATNSQILPKKPPSRQPDPQTQQSNSYGIHYQAYQNQQVQHNQQSQTTGYNNQGYYNQGYHNQGPNSQGYNNQGYSNQGPNSQGYNNQGFNNRGYNNQGYNNHGYNHRDYHNPGFQNEGYQYPGFPNSGSQNRSHHIQGYSNQGYSNQGYSNQSYSNEGYLNQGYLNQSFQNQPLGFQASTFIQGPQNQSQGQQNQFKRQNQLQGQNQFQGQQLPFQGTPNTSQYNHRSPNSEPPKYPQSANVNVHQNMTNIPAVQDSAQVPMQTETQTMTSNSAPSKPPTEVQRIRGERQRLLAYEKYSSNGVRGSDEKSSDSTQNQQQNNSMYTGNQISQKNPQQPVIPTGPAAYNQPPYNGQSSSKGRQFQHSGALAQAQNLLQTLQDSQPAPAQDQSKELRDMLARLSGLG